jgi:hypothetical protein
MTTTLQYTVIRDADRELDADTWGATNRTRPYFGCWLVWDNNKGEYTGDMFRTKHEAQGHAEEMNVGLKS